LSRAERPLIVLGKGAAYAQADEQIRMLVEQTGIPFLPMSMAKGMLDDNHSQSASAARSYVLGNADVVLLIGARLNWLLSHGKGPVWSESTQYVQIDIDPTEIDSNRSIAAPIVGDIKSSVDALLAAMKPGSVKPSAAWVEDIGTRKQKNMDRMAERLRANPDPMNFSSALGAVREILTKRPDVYVVNEGANALDFARNIIDMKLPRHRLDSGTWGIMGIGMGYAIAAAIETGKPVVAIEGDSAFGFSGMEIETICRYRLPVTIVILNNGGIYRGDTTGGEPSPTGFVSNARYDKLIEAFGGRGYHCTDAESLAQAVQEGLSSGLPTLINAVIDPTAGTESGHIQSLNPKSALQK
jgi:oxalyl-CoA decarboxylase